MDKFSSFLYIQIDEIYFYQSVTFEVLNLNIEYESWRAGNHCLYRIPVLLFSFLSI